MFTTWFWVVSTSFSLRYQELEQCVNSGSKVPSSWVRTFSLHVSTPTQAFAAQTRVFCNRCQTLQLAQNWILAVKRLCMLGSEWGQQDRVDLAGKFLHSQLLSPETCLRMCVPVRAAMARTTDLVGVYLHPPEGWDCGEQVTSMPKVVT